MLVSLLSPNSDRVMIPLGGYNCSICHTQLRPRLHGSGQIFARTNFVPGPPVIMDTCKFWTSRGILMDFFYVSVVIGPLQDPVTWYGINYAGTQMRQWEFENKGKSGWTGKNSFVLEVPLRYLRPSVIYSVPCYWILQSAYWSSLMLKVRGKSNMAADKHFAWSDGEINLLLHVVIDYKAGKAEKGVD